MSKKKSNRGSLVKEISKPLPGEILENDWLKDEIKGLLKNHSGLYGLYKNDKLYYVGLATNLHSRTKDHINDRHAGKWNKFKLIVIKKVKYINDLEALALSLYKPSGNKNIPGVPNSYHINKLMKGIIKSTEAYLSKLRKKHLEDIKMNKQIKAELVALRKGIH